MTKCTYLAIQLGINRTFEKKKKKQTFRSSQKANFTRPLKLLKQHTPEEISKEFDIPLKRIVELQ